MSRAIASIFTALLAAIVAAAGQQAPDRGSVRGKVTLTKHIRGSAMPSAAYPARSVNRHETPAGPEIRNVIVYIKDPGYRGPLPAHNAEVRQENETFVPRTLAVTKGSTVAFPNDDPFFHNVFSLSSAAAFNLGRFPRGQTRSQTFNKPGLVKVFCQIHSHMSATIFVFDHPYYTVPGNDGTYQLPLVPPGRYTVVGWHERVGERTAQVRVEAGQAVSADLSLPVEDTP
jgi:plastocyanin